MLALEVVCLIKSELSVTETVFLKLDNSQKNMTIKYSGLGIISKKTISLEFNLTESHGCVFVFADGTRVEALTDNIVAAKRNTVLGKNKNTICFVEHLLATLNLLRIQNVEVFIDGPEIPLEDGSGVCWFNLLQPYVINNQGSTDRASLFELKENLIITDNKGNTLIALPSEELRLTYFFESPVDKSQIWSSWSLKDGIEKLIRSRTFASSVEHEMLGLKGKLLSYDKNGFDLPLQWPDEPALHKLLDLFGDLSLCGHNPLDMKIHFISIKGGHELNTQMAKSLRALGR